jgi:predicted nucleic acid-binding Zn finger protein
VSNPVSAKEWYLIARFTTRADKDQVFFVKTREASRGQDLICTCDSFAANLVNGKGHCKHTKFCKLKVIDHAGSIPIEKLPPKRVTKNRKILNLWMERNVGTYLIE